MQDFNFIYDGISLQSMGYMVCDFDSRSSVDKVTTDSQRNFKSTSMYGGKYQPFTVSTYDDRIEFTFNICKRVCNTIQESTLNLMEIKSLKRWLNRPEPHKFKIIYKEYADYYFEGSFNVQEVFYGNLRVGLELTFISNRPFGMHEPVLYTADLTSTGVLSIADISDEIGYIYPDLTITCKASGDLELLNSFDDRKTLIKNCKTGEVIHFSPTLLLASSIDSHKIQDDFNFTFLRISNSIYSRANNITASLPCHIRIQYSPIAKVVI